MKFIELGLGNEVLKAVHQAGYTKPTPIQKEAIPVILQGKDILGCAQTGTGKTASFSLPIIEILNAGYSKARMPRSLILEPTRELAAQVAESFDKYNKSNKLTYALLIGGVKIDDQLKLIDKGVDVLIATPGRLLDLIDNGKLLLSGIKIMVIDEADRMLDMGFIPDVERIVKISPPLRQTLFFSATMPKEIRVIAEKFLHNPKEITITPPSTVAKTIKQYLTIVPEDKKINALKYILENEPKSNSIIFCNRKIDINKLSISLAKIGLENKELHGNLSQHERTKTLKNFKEGKISILICSDVAARGIDIEALPLVILYDIPKHPEDYVHRIGRTGRAGSAGKAISIATKHDNKYISAIQDLTKTEFEIIEIKNLPRVKFNQNEDVNKKKNISEPLLGMGSHTPEFMIIDYK
ncbi:DEAD/DEAH box helicase [Alphaproteobacteria bacterium]|nr:DEAD/DEAH box helicase [Alphaproteobacteria bacterium]